MKLRMISVAAVALASGLLPTFAQTPQAQGDSVSCIEDMNIADIPNESIVVISKDDSEDPGYVHEKYVFVSSDCPGGAQIVDYSGPPIDPKDPNVLRNEATICAREMLDGTTSGD